MSDHDALLAAILANPDDDLPRLVFADFLEEQGHPALTARAAYIRLQIEAEQHPIGSAMRFEINRRTADLRDNFRDEWDQEFNDPSEWYGFTAVRRRGFVSEVQTSLERLRQIGKRMFAAAPVVALYLTHIRNDNDVAMDWDDIHTRLSFLNRVQTLRFGSLSGDIRVWVTLLLLLKSDYLLSVTQLSLANSVLEDFMGLFCKVLQGAVIFEGLIEFDLRNNHITDDGARALATMPGLNSLQVLDLTGNRITPVGAAILRERFGDRVRV